MRSPIPYCLPLTTFLLLSLWTTNPLLVQGVVPPSFQTDTVAFQLPFTLATHLQRRFSSSLRSLFNMDQTKPIAAGKKFGLREAYHVGIGDKSHERARTSFGFSITADDVRANQAELDYIPAVRTVRHRFTRLTDVQRLIEVRRRSLEEAVCASSMGLDWEEVEVEAPDVADRGTVLAFAKMAASAYRNDTTGWEGVGGFDPTDSFGWEGDGIRGHVFTTQHNDTIIVALKGTSNAFLGGGDTAKRDKTNDNLLFSCCCARVSWSWSTVCDCYQGHGDTCGQTCLERALVEKSLYYPAITDLFNNISYAYPDSQVWITGHSLGGALSSLLGMTFGVPTITFQSPGERMAAMRLHLPLPPPTNPEDSPISALPIVHIYNNADPIATGQCNGAASLCSNFGYAMESKCHSGKSIVYDTVGKLGWSQSVNAHRINTLVEDVLTEDWSEKVRKKKAQLHNHRVTQTPGEVGRMGWRWPWNRRDDATDDGDSDGDSDEDTDEDDKLAVPKPRSEDKCRDCTSWHFVDDTSHGQLSS